KKNTKNSNLLPPQIDENAKSPPPSRFFSWKARISSPLKTRKNAKSPPLCWTGKTHNLPSPESKGKALNSRTSEAGETTKSHPPLQRGKPRLSPLQGREACAPPAQRARKSLHSSLSKGRELHAPGRGPFLVSPSSTCFKYFKSHSGHVCHFAELIYARLYLFQNNAVLVFCYVCEDGNKFYSLCLCNEESFTLGLGKSHLLHPTCLHLPEFVQ
ncbi:hypothetical protein T4A_13746, partial [Trichinella pseudospiralis]